MTERVVPRRPGEWESRASYLMYLRHLAAYSFVQPMTEGRRVLDLGSGTGYGTAILADGAREVIALDVALNALISIRLEVVTIASVAGNGTQLPLRDETVDLVVSFQVIEHIWDEARYLDEVRRVLIPEGLFIVSTPNKALRLLPFQPPFNPYHVREYDYHSLKKVLGRRFDDVKVWGLRGTPEVMVFERERLRQNPLKVYMGMLAQKTLLPSVREGLWSLVRILRREESSEVNIGVNLVPQPLFSEDAYSVNDFWVGPNSVEACLDLIGICRKG